MSALRIFLRRYGRGHFRAIILFSVLSNIMVLAPAFHMLQVYDRVLNSGSIPTLLYITAIVLFALAVYGFAEAMRLRIAHRLSAKYAVMNSEKIFASLAHETSAGDAARALRDFTTVRSYMANRAFVGLFDVPFIPLFLLLLFMVHWSVGVLTLLGIAAMVLVSILNNRATEADRTASAKTEAEANAFAQSAFTRAEDVRSMGLLPAFISEWSTKTSTALRAGEAVNGKSSAYYATGKAVRQAVQVSIMGWGAFLVLAGNMSGGLIFLASMIAGKALGPIEMLIGGWDGLSKALTAFLATEKLLSEDRIRTRPSLPAARGHLTCENISFSATDGQGTRNIVQDVTLSVAPGELLVITGPAASGKSVLAKILVGAMEPSDGVLRLDGAAHDQWPTAQWGRAVGYVAQEAKFFPGTVAANIARFTPSFQPKDVYDAAAKAGVHEHIVHLPRGYQTIIGTGSLPLPSSVSQGVALARALFGNPKCLVLDQPSTHLDQSGEERLIETLVAAKARGVSIVVVTRRSAIFKLANHLMIMRDGRLVPLDARQFSTSGPRGPAHAETSPVPDGAPVLESATPHDETQAAMAG